MDSRRNRTHIQKLKITYHMKLNKPLTEVQPAPEEAFDLTATVGTQEAQSVSEQLKLPNPNNKLLNQLYLDHVSVVEEKQFQECAGYYAQALYDAGQEIQDILENPDVTIQKSVAITELIKTWKL